jgi:hypothetical protein
MRRLPSTLRGWVVLGFGAVGIGLLPWAFWLSASLKPHHVTERWDLAWSGFDVGLAMGFCGTAVAAYRRSPWVGAFAAATGTLLLADAWFDIVLESHSDERRNAILLAAFVELPVAAFCFLIAYRTERLLTMLVGPALHLTTTRESPTERNLVRVLEVSPDGEAAGESRDADASA